MIAAQHTGQQARSACWNSGGQLFRPCILVLFVHSSTYKVVPGVSALRIDAQGNHRRSDVFGIVAVFVEATL